MVPALTSHPAVRLGIWLRNSRQERGIVKRIFAGLIGLSASKYSEVEAGVVRWIKFKQERAIEAALDMEREQIREFRSMLHEARKAAELTFAMIFTRAQLEPVRLRSDDHEQITAEQKELLLRAVFTPLI